MARLADNSIADPEWVQKLKHGGAFPLSDSPLCAHAWTSPPGNNFSVRGAHYLETKAKVPAGDPVLQPIAFDIIKSSSKVFDIMEHPRCRVRTALHTARASATEAGDGVQQKPFVWVFNLQFPMKDNPSLVLYFVSFHNPEKGSLMQRFLDGDDAFRRERLKMLTTIPEGPQLVKLVVGDKGPGFLVGKLMSCRYRREKEYMEVDVDVGSSIIASTAVQVCSGFAQLVMAELAFVIEGRRKDELPEKIVGAMRLANLDFSRALSLDSPRVAEPVTKECKRRPSYIGGLWRLASTSMAQGAETARQLLAKDVDEEKKGLCQYGISKTRSLP